jgi:hypothetical protein
MDAERRSAVWLAKQLNCDRSNIYRIYQKEVIDTCLLFNISKVLHFDFFQFYSSSFHPDENEEK